MDNVLLFEAQIFKLGTDDLVEKVYLLAYGLFQADHILSEMIFDEDDGIYQFPVEIGSISRVREVNRILNPEFILDMAEESGHMHEYKGDIPLKMAEGLSDEDAIVFDCDCHEKLRVAGGNWPYVTCPNCDLKILRSEIKSAGGIYYYQASEKK
jgi:hypothetical protein